jgi:hypothetical protein
MIQSGGFDYAILNDPEFKEDAVREEIIAPILRALGYAASGPNRIIRSRRLLHPFVSIGSARKEIFIIPDYLMEVSNKNAWIMEAKAPIEEVTKSVHVEQAYSYAIHNEIRVNYFALCNGKSFVLYDIEEVKPLFDFKIQLLYQYWNDIKGRLEPSNVFKTGHPFAKDLGLHLKRLGFANFESIIFPKVLALFLGRIDEDLFTFGATATLDNNEKYAASFDFNFKTACQLQGIIPEKGFEILTRPFTGIMHRVHFQDPIYLNVEVSIGENLEENDKEIFLPLWVKRFIK